ncbi:MAG: DUF2726 domain-containing protein [Candidatus Shapirobacteria bacterium]|nr:DUF2726 domain-containing protein [Candidatus Shapirobacteria bacterium]
MTITLWTIVIVLSVVVIFQFVKYSNLEKRFYEIKDGYLNLAIKKKLISRRKFIRYDESEMYKTLVNAVGNNFIVIPQVHLCDIADVKVGYLDHDNLYYELKKIIYDYAIFDKNFEPLVLIELNGKSHFQDNRINRDAIAENNAKNLDIPFIPIKKEDRINEKLLREKLSPYLKLSTV